MKAALAGAAEAGRVSTSFHGLSPRLGPEPKAALVAVADPWFRRILAHLLGEAGYEALEASSAEVAFQASEGRGGPIHLLLCDPGANLGPGLAAALGRLRPGLKVIFIPGPAEDVGEGPAPAAPYLPGASTPRELLAEVARLLSAPEA